MKNFKFVAVLVFFLSHLGFAGGKLLSANTSSEQDILRLELNFDQLFDSNSVGIQYTNKLMSLNIPDMSFKKSLPTLETKSSFVKNLKFKEGDNKNISLEIEFTDVTAMQMKENLALESMGKTLIIEVLPPAIQNINSTKEPTTNTELAMPVSGKLNDNLLKNSELNSTKQISQTALEESKIPLFEKKDDKPTENNSGMTKIAIMVIGLLCLGGYLIWFLKNKSKMVNGPESLMKIKMITQFHLGPKKSLAVIRVAGESLLLSITDTQISLIKSLALLDEDIPESTPMDFAASLNAEDQNQNNQPRSRDSNSDQLNADEEFSFGPATKTSLTNKIPLLRKII